MAQTSALHEIPTRSLKVSKFNARRSVSDISELVSSIESVGILEPIVVRPVGKQFEIIIGSRRFAAARRVGLKTVPAIVRKMTDDQAVVESLAENLQRGDIEEEEVVRAYNQLKNFDSKKWTQASFAQKIGKSQEWISKLLAAYESFIKLKEAGVVRGMRSYPREEEREKGYVPVRHLTEIEYAIRSPDVRQKVPERQLEKKRVELAKAVLDLPQDDALKVIDRFKMYPEKPMEQVKREAVAAKSGVALETYLKPSLARDIEEKLGRQVEEVVPELLERGLEAMSKEKAQSLTREVPVKEGTTYDIGKFECPIHKRQYTLKCDGKKVSGRHWVE